MSNKTRPPSAQPRDSRSGRFCIVNSSLLADTEHTNGHPHLEHCKGEQVAEPATRDAPIRYAERADGPNIADVWRRKGGPTKWI
ncbi:hypothetical protein VTK73DRAFT_152 [Phialemonium thermophilum]|uniref:Uncharacterized protein n=1 Tax=Phialemonium thermophilum TaxID=223376 RepID=A0ABR3VWU7_9PEZI